MRSNIPYLSTSIYLIPSSPEYTLMKNLLDETIHRFLPVALVLCNFLANNNFYVSTHLHWACKYLHILWMNFRGGYERVEERWTGSCQSLNTQSLWNCGNITVDCLEVTTFVVHMRPLSYIHPLQPPRERKRERVTRQERMRVCEQWMTGRFSGNDVGKLHPRDNNRELVAANGVHHTVPNCQERGGNVSRMKRGTIPTRWRWHDVSSRGGISRYIHFMHQTTRRIRELPVPLNFHEFSPAPEEMI